MYIPTTEQEIIQLGWDRPDIILVTGDTYIDSPYVGTAVIGKYLMKHGFKVAIIAQPSLDDTAEIMRLGEPALFWGVTGGCIDSMVANYTPQKKWRNQDDYTPGGVNRRPDRAAIAYTNLIRRAFKNTRPVVLGGIEASLRRIAHYDYWDNAVRRSVLLDAKADILAYGMAEKTVLALARALKEGTEWKSIPGLCRATGAGDPAVSPESFPGFTVLPSFEEVKDDRRAFFRMFKTFMEKIEDPRAGFLQKHGDRWLVHNPPQPVLSTEELDEVSELEFEYDVHPFYRTGEVRALDTIRQSITTHRGCFGQCSFCAITVHQGRTVVSRSAGSVLREAERLARLPRFNGIIYDVGGPTANMYAARCTRGGTPCADRSCLMPQPCPKLKFGHRDQLDLLDRLLKIPGMKKVFIASGVRHDMVAADQEWGGKYVEKLVANHVSGQLKLAPENYDNEVLVLMNKPSIKPLMKFKALFDEACRSQGKRFFLTYYLMVAHPGCTVQHILRLKDFLKGGLKLLPEQVQIFTPTPATWSSTMYWCECDRSGGKIFCEKSPNARQNQKDILKRPEQRQFYGSPRQVAHHQNRLQERARREHRQSPNRPAKKVRGRFSPFKSR